MGRPSFAWHVIAEGDDGPGPRSRHGLVCDRGTNALVLFGGLVEHDRRQCVSDTWELKRGLWSRIRTATEPPGRHRGAMVFDSNRGCTVLFGGQTRGNASWPFLGDTWTYEDRRWTKRAGWFWKAPPPRCGHAMAFDEEFGMTVVFGGINPQGEPMGDTWVFNGNRWRQLRVEGPSPRRYAAFAYHPGMKGCILHGGAVDDEGRVKFGESWLFRDGQWTSLGDDFETSARDDHGLAYHFAAARMIMLDGLLRDRRGEVKREVLVLTRSGWRSVTTEPLHPRMQCSPLAYDNVLGGLVMHGGETCHGGEQFDETRILRLESVSSAHDE